METVSYKMMVPCFFLYYTNTNKKYLLLRLFWKNSVFDVVKDCFGKQSVFDVVKDCFLKQSVFDVVKDCFGKQCF